MLALLTTQRATGGHSFGFEHRAAGATGPASLRRSAAHLPTGPDSDAAGMPQRAWSQRRERQHDHIKAGLLDRGEDEDTAEEIAARTVNKERARAGEARRSSQTSTQDISSGRRGGLRSHSGSGGRTRDQLYQEARAKGIKGRSKMSKAELERAIGR
jgi:hypothetical protein